MASRKPRQENTTQENNYGQESRGPPQQFINGGRGVREERSALDDALSDLSPTPRAKRMKN